MNSGMFPVSFNSALKKMRYYNNKAIGTTKQPTTAMSNPEAGSSQSIVPLEEEGDIEIVKTPSTYIECQKGMVEWIDRAETFSSTSKECFQQWAKRTEVCLAKAQLEEETYHNIQTRIDEAEKHKAKSRCVIQKGGVLTIEEARRKQHEKEVKQRLAAVKRARKSIHVAVNKAKTALNRLGIDARKAEREESSKSAIFKPKEKLFLQSY